MNGLDKKIEMAKWLFEKQLGWNAAAEIKTGVVVTLNLAAISGLAALFIDVETPTTMQYGLSGIALICPTIAIGLTARSVSPQLDGPKDSLLYFGRIGEKKRQAYLDEFDSASESDFLKDILEQTHRNAEIVRLKFLQTSRAIKCSFVGVIPWFAAVIGLCI